MKRVINPNKALRTLRKTPTILTTILKGVSQEQAQTLRDGAAGWSILHIVCHLRDVEAIFTQRVIDLLETAHPTFTVVANDELMRRTNYAAQSLAVMLQEYSERRQHFIKLLDPLTDAQWLLTGVHPEQGPATLLDVAINTGLHDVDHIEQIIRCLEGE